MNAIRAVLTVIVSYIAMAAVIFAGFSLYFLAIGVEGAYQPATYEVTFLWIAGSTVISIAAALAGGWICKKLGKNRKTVVGLVGLVAVLGIMSFVGQLARANDPRRERPDDVPVMQAAAESRQPIWVSALNPVIGVIGTAVGGGLLKPKPKA